MDLLVLASPSSWCGLRVVDKSTQILYADQELTSEKIYSMFPYNMRSGYDYIVDESQPGSCWGPIPLEEDAPFRRPWRPWNQGDSYMDILGLFKDASVKILTNVQIQKLVKRIKCWYPAFSVDMAAPMVMKEGHEVNREPSSMPIPEAAVRKNFPETWLWSLVSVGNTGQTRLKVTVPDTITEWNGGIICTGISGFGLSPPASLRVFKSLFVEMSLPYSVVRGELFTLKASVFNYLRVCIKVEVSVSASTDVQVAPCPGCQYSLCVCSNRAVLFKWDVTAKTAGMATFTVTATTVPSTQLCEGQKIDLPAAGRIDIERRQLLVKPGGIRKEEAQSFIFCLKDTNNVATGSCSLQLPSTVVEGSVSAYVAVMGDLLGSALQNLNNLIQMPYGCGEQNMLTTSSIVYVLKYLEATGRLTPELRTLATGYLQSGYQRQLNYKHSDGSFSAFGESDSEGSTWLTAFVVLCFTHARSHIFVDNDVLNKAVIWLKSLQQADGCFMNKGRVIHTLMKGGVEDDLSLAAYVTAAILGLGVPQNDPVLVNALTCLRNSLSHLTNPYTMALFAYVFSLANDLTTRTMLLDKLYLIAQTSNGETYWEYTLQSGSSGGVSANVELTSYVSLALVSVSSVSTADILKAAQIVKWLVQRQNPNGGYSSTQDTVVAIHALSEYLRLTYSNTMNILVKVTGINGFMTQFQVYKNNSLLLQREDLPNVPGSYSLYVSGSGCAFIQCVLKYNIYPINSRAAFALNASVSHSGCNKQGLQYNVLRISVSYNGSRNATNMVLMEVGLPSGFSPNADSIAMLRTMVNVKKVTTTPTSVTIYFEQLTSNTAVYQLIIEQNFLVKNVKPAVIKIWDYYLKEESAEISYTVPPCD